MFPKIVCPGCLWTAFSTRSLLGVLRCAGWCFSSNLGHCGLYCFKIFFLFRSLFSEGGFQLHVC